MAYSGKVRQGCAAKVAPCHKYMWTLLRLGCGMSFDAARPKKLIGKLSVPSKEAARHMMRKGFQNGISQFEKKIRPSSPILFHSFGNPKVCKKFFFHEDGIALVAYAEQLLSRQSCSVLHSATRHSVDAPLVMRKLSIIIIDNYHKHIYRKADVQLRCATHESV